MWSSMTRDATRDGETPTESTSDGGGRARESASSARSLIRIWRSSLVCHQRHSQVPPGHQARRMVDKARLSDDKRADAQERSGPAAETGTAISTQSVSRPCRLASCAKLGITTSPNSSVDAVCITMNRHVWQLLQQEPWAGIYTRVRTCLLRDGYLGCSRSPHPRSRDATVASLQAAFSRTCTSIHSGTMLCTVLVNM